MKILFISSLCSESKYSQIVSARKKEVLDPSQRLFSNLVYGLSRNNEITCISTLPVSRKVDNRRLFRKSVEKNGSVDYIYLPFINNKLLKIMSIAYFATVEILKWHLVNFRDERIVICDPLLLISSSITRFVSRLFSVKSIAYVTDVPKYISVIKQNSTKLENAFNHLAYLDSKKYDGYILVTEFQRAFFRHGKPSIVIDEIINTEKDIVSIGKDEHEEFRIVYAGGLYKKFGVEKLAKAFMNIDQKNLRLIFYGAGESREYLSKMRELDQRIVLKGFVQYADLKFELQKADLLINTRSSQEEFTKYSFPSKTIVYMCSGVPVLSTRIRGISKDYEDLLIWIEDESEKGIENAIRDVMKRKTVDLKQLGENARNFVVSNKNIHCQTGKINEFIRKHE